MSLRKLLGLEEGRDEKSLDTMKPAFLSSREIFEDVESIKNNDPILTLAAIIRKDGEGRHSTVDSDIKELIDAVQRRRRRESSSHNQSPTHPFHHLHLASVLSQRTPSSEEEEADESGREGEEDGNEEASVDYDKLKHFMTVCDNSQDLMSALEGEINGFQGDVGEHFKQSEQEVVGGNGGSSSSRGSSSPQSHSDLL